MGWYIVLCRWCFLIKVSAIPLLRNHTNKNTRLFAQDLERGPLYFKNEWSTSSTMNSRWRIRAKERLENNFRADKWLL